MILAQISLLTTRKVIGLNMMLCIQFSPVAKWNVFICQRGLPFRPHFVSQKQRTKAMVMHIQNDRKRRGVRCERCQRRTHISLLALHVRDKHGHALVILCDPKIHDLHPQVRKYASAELTRLDPQTSSENCCEA